MKPETFANQGKGAAGIRQPGMPPMVWQRDIANCLPFIIRNATIMTQGIYDDQKDELEILDSIVQFLHKIYEDSRVDRMKGLSQFRNLCEYISYKGAVGSEVFATFSTLFLTSVFTYLYGSKQMAIQSPDSLDVEECYDFQQVISLFSLMGKETADSFLDEVRQNGVLPSGFDLNALKKTVGNYLDDIQKNQEERYAENAEELEQEVTEEP